MTKSSQNPIKDRAGKYELEFPPNSLTAADTQTLNTIAVLEIQLDKIHKELAELSPDRADYAQRLKSLIDALNKTSAEHRQLLKSMRLDRQSRTSLEESELELRIPQLAKAAYDLLADYAICILCPECQGETASINLKQGLIIFHFAQTNAPFDWKSECPRCRLLKNKIRTVHIHNENWYRYTPAFIQQRIERERKGEKVKDNGDIVTDDVDELDDETLELPEPTNESPEPHQPNE